MRFGNSQVLFYLWWLLSATLLFFFWAERKYRKASIRFAQEEALKKIAPSYGGKSRKAVIFLNLAAIFLIGLALSRPQWGLDWKEKKAKGLDILFALDASRSMLAQDIKPGRLVFAKEEIKDFVKRLKGDRVGLIAFSGEAFLYCPLTMDYNGFFLVLDSINTGSIGKGGTSVLAAVEEARRGFEWALADQKILVIISDGEDTSDGVKDAAEKAKEAGIQVFCIGIGTKEGEVIPYTDDKGNKTFLKDKDGNIVRSRLDEDALKDISLKTGGIYFHASPERFGLDYIYEERLIKFKRQEAEEALEKAYKERFQVFLALAVFIVFLEMVLTVANKDEKY